MSQRWWWLAAVALLLGGLGYLFTRNLTNNLVYYYTTKELREREGTLNGVVVRLGGFVQQSSLYWNGAEGRWHFVVSDLQDAEISAIYRGSKPALLGDGQGVVLEGSWNGKNEPFVVKQLMVKHGATYSTNSAQHQHEQMRNKKMR